MSAYLLAEVLVKLYDAVGRTMSERHTSIYVTLMFELIKKKTLMFVKQK